jgi:NADH-quinone oxidoreductase subunit E
VSRLSPERTALAKEIIARYPVARSALIPLVHLAQEQDGYVTEEAMEQIAELLDCTPAEIYGVASFYEMFSFRPVGRYKVGICTNISCLLDGAFELLEHAEHRLGIRVGGTTDDGVFSLEDAECLAACTEAPCVQVNYRYFARVKPDDFDRLVDDLRAGRLDDTVPPHGTLARIRQTVAPDRWAASGSQPPPRPPDPPVAALRGEPPASGGPPANGGPPASGGA